MYSHFTEKIGSCFFKRALNLLCLILVDNTSFKYFYMYLCAFNGAMAQKNGRLFLLESYVILSQEGLIRGLVF